MSDLLPCPFCGCTPELPSGDGTQYEISCDCGMAASSVQICDCMTIEERSSSLFTNFRYEDEFIERARVEATQNWNKRIAKAPYIEAYLTEAMDAERSSSDTQVQVARLEKALTLAANRLDRLSISVDFEMLTEVAEWCQEARAALSAQGETP